MKTLAGAARKMGAALIAAGALATAAPVSAQSAPAAQTAPTAPTATIPWPAIGAPGSSARTVGRWLWADLVSTDVARSRDFYGRVFGWEFRDVAGSDGLPGYVTIVANGQPIGGIVTAPNGAKAAGKGARWIGLVSGDPKTTATRAIERGGTVVLAPRMLPGRGEVAVIADPKGAPFGVILTEQGDPADFVGGVNEWLWAELWTPEPGRAVDFYQALFGYTVSAAPGKGGAGYVLSAGGRARAGVLMSPDPGLPAAWVPYLRVADVAQTVALAREHGARVVVAPRRHHRRQVAVLVDPLGAPFAVADWGTR